MLVVVGGTKGGTGKTTVSTNLATVDALKGVDVLLVDCDKQGSASAWSAVRDETDLPHVNVVQKFGGLSLKKDLADLEGRYQRVYVDAGGFDSEELRASLLIASTLLIPMRPSQLDVWSLPRIIEIVGQSQMYNPKLEVLFVLNGVHPSPNVKDAEGVVELAEEVEGMVFAQSVIHQRLSFTKASGMGLSVVELQGRDRDVKAAAEITSLYEEVTNG